MSNVVMFSGGITSWAAARRIAEEQGTDDLVLLFADTLAEDPDLYRFLDEAAADIGVPITRVADGRTPWEVFHDERFVGNASIAPCSKLLKQVPCRRWLTEHTDPATTTVHVGIDWTETNRIAGIVKGWAPWTVRTPLTEPPLRDKSEWIAEARARGIEPPRLYGLGFVHNNCGGACVRAGQAQWAHLLRVFPDRFAAAEAAEESMRQMLDKDVAILRDRRGGAVKPLPLVELRRRIQGPDDASSAIDGLDWGGCGCFLDTEAAA